MAKAPKNYRLPTEHDRTRSDRHPGAQHDPRVAKPRMRRRPPSRSRTGRSDDSAGFVLPQLDAELAAVLAKCLSAGLVPTQAMAYALPSVTDEETLKALATKFMADPLMLQAVNALNGGAWPDLELHARAKVAWDKHVSEMALFLVTHNVASMNSDEMKVAKDAREVLQSELKGTTDPDDPLAAFSRLAQDLLKQTQKPVQMVHTLPVPSAPRKES